MFFKKSKSGNNLDIDVCDDCGAAFLRDKLFIVEVDNHTKDIPTTTKKYCNQHKKNYDRVLITYHGNQYFCYKQSYEVDRNGKPV